MGSAWCMYMRFARRSQDQVASRKVFAQARKAKHLDWRVFDYAGVSLDALAFVDETDFIWDSIDGISSYEGGEYCDKYL